MFDEHGTNDLVLPPLAGPDALVGEEGQSEQSVDAHAQPQVESDSGGHWILMPMPPHVETDEVWHYTDPGGAVGMLRTRELWATSIASLNDSAEFAHGLEVLSGLADEVSASRNIHPMQKQHIARVVERVNATLEASQLYVFCASEEADSLSQWRGYGAAGVGYAVALETAGQLAVLDEASAPRSLPPAGPWPVWGKVLYDASEQRELLLQGITFCAMTAPRPEVEGSDPDMWLRHGVGVMTGLLAFCKHPAFKDEREVRVVTTAPLEAVRFRPSRFGIAPYVRLIFVDDEERARYGTVRWTMREAGPLPLRATCVGPTANVEPAMHGMNMLISSLGIDGVPVHHSKTPYR